MYSSCRQLVPKSKSGRSKLIDLCKLSPLSRTLLGKRELEGGERQKGSASGTFFRNGEEAFPSSRLLSYSGLSPPFDACQKEGKTHLSVRRKKAKEMLLMALDYEEESPTWLS